MITDKLNFITVDWITKTTYELSCILEQNFILVLFIIAVLGFIYGWLYNGPKTQEEKDTEKVVWWK